MNSRVLRQGPHARQAVRGAGHPEDVEYPLLRQGRQRAPADLLDDEATERHASVGIVVSCPWRILLAPELLSITEDTLLHVLLQGHQAVLAPRLPAPLVVHRRLVVHEAGGVGEEMPH